MYASKEGQMTTYAGSLSTAVEHLLVEWRSGELDTKDLVIGLRVLLEAYAHVGAAHHYSLALALQKWSVLLLDDWKQAALWAVVRTVDPLVIDARNDLL